MIVLRSGPGRSGMIPLVLEIPVSVELVAIVESGVNLGFVLPVGPERYPCEVWSFLSHGHDM